MNEKKYGVLSLPLIVPALGYFVDIYDLLLFNIVREPSLQGIGIALTDKAQVLAASTRIINWQMIGLLIGAVTGWLLCRLCARFQFLTWGVRHG